MIPGISSSTIYRVRKMRRNYADVVIAGAVAILGCIAIYEHLPAPVVIILGLGLFVAPGYVWSEVLLSASVRGLERVAVMIGLALMVPVLGGLVLYVARIPLHRATWVGLLAVVTVTGTMVVLAIRPRPDEPRARGEQAERKRWRAWHVVNFCAASMIAAVAVGLAVYSANVQKYPGYTQLWLSPVRSDPVTATLGVTNQQGTTTQYRLVLLRKGRVSATWNLTLTDGQTWQHTVPFTEKYSIAADLYRLPDLSHPYRDVDNGELLVSSLRVVQRQSSPVERHSWIKL